MNRTLIVILGTLALAGAGYATVLSIEVPEASVAAPAVEPPAPSVEHAAPHAAAPGGHVIASGDAVVVHFTTFLGGKPWKSTYGWVAELIVASTDGDLGEFNASEFEPLDLVADQEYPTNPILTRIAASLPGRHLGEHFALDAADAFGAAEERKVVTIPRSYGPFPASVEWDRAKFVERFGEPVVGAEVATNRVFNSSVVSADEGFVVTRSLAQDGTVVALPYVHAFLRVEAVDGEDLRFVIDPVRDVSFRVTEGVSFLRLAPGQYAVTDFDEESITYAYHPEWSPFLVGLDFSLLVDVLSETPTAVVHGHQEE